MATTPFPSGVDALAAFVWALPALNEPPPTTGAAVRATDTRIAASPAATAAVPAAAATAVAARTSPATESAVAATAGEALRRLANPASVGRAAAVAAGASPTGCNRHRYHLGMRVSVVVRASLLCALLATACGPAAAPSPRAAPPTPAAPAANVARQTAFLERARLLAQAWDADVVQGVPAASLVPLRQQLLGSPYETAPATAALWAKDDGSTLLSSLTDETAAAWSAAVTAAHQRATAVLDSWTALVTQYGSNVPADAVTAEGSWPAELDAAPGPAAIDQLAASWSTALDSAQSAAAAAQAAAAKLAAELQPYTSISDLVDSAAGLLAAARDDNLGDMQVPAPLAALRAVVAGGGDPGAAIAALQGPVRALSNLVAQDKDVARALAGLQSDIGSAQALNTTHAGGFPGQYDAIAAAFRAATDSPSLSAVSAQIAQLDNVVNNDPAANGCARSSGGKLIAISLNRQSVTFSEDGCVVRTSLVTTGRAQLRTPTGTFHILSKATQFTFISPWPKGSAYYYVPSLANYVMLFAAGGFYIHDAPWEPDSQFGPGSEDSFNASHGCVHIESTVMPWLYGWADVGTTVVITG
jgi:lipoprotein-anchoring transpeptidase ErfK/SrfK